LATGHAECSIAAFGLAHVLADEPVSTSPEHALAALRQRSARGTVPPWSRAERFGGLRGFTEGANR